MRHMTESDRQRAAATRTLMKSPQKALKSASLALDATQEASVLKTLVSCPESIRALYLKAISGTSPAAGIKAHCLQCVGWDKGEVRNCTGYACPLYPYRPYRKEARP